MNNELTIKLTEPIEAHGELMGEVKIALPLRFKHVRGLLKGGPGDEDQKIEALLQKILAVPPSTIGEMCVQDVAAIMGALSPFLQPFQNIADGSSPN